RPRRRRTAAPSSTNSDGSRGAPVRRALGAGVVGAPYLSRGRRSPVSPARASLRSADAVVGLGELRAAVPLLLHLGEERLGGDLEHLEARREEVELVFGNLGEGGEPTIEVLAVLGRDAQRRARAVVLRTAVQGVEAHADRIEGEVRHTPTHGPVVHVAPRNDPGRSEMGADHLPEVGPERRGDERPERRILGRRGACRRSVMVEHAQRFGGEVELDPRRPPHVVQAIDDQLLDGLRRALHGHTTEPIAAAARRTARPRGPVREPFRAAWRVALASGGRSWACYPGFGWPMRLGILSDIHANYEALSAVVEAYRHESIDEYQ